MYKVVGYFTDRDEIVDRPEFGYTDKDHIQWEDGRVLSESDAKVELTEVAMRVLKDDLMEYGKIPRAEFFDDRKTIAIFYEDGDISTYKVEQA